MHLILKFVFSAKELEMAQDDLFYDERFLESWVGTIVSNPMYLLIYLSLFLRKSDKSDDFISPNLSISFSVNA